MTEELRERRISAFLKLRHLLWVPSWKTPDGTRNLNGRWWETRRPFTWSPQRPCPDGGRDFPNPDMEWRHPTLDDFLFVWERLDEGEV